MSALTDYLASREKRLQETQKERDYYFNELSKRNLETLNLLRENKEARQLLKEWYSWEHSRSLQARTRIFLGVDDE